MFTSIIFTAVGLAGAGYSFIVSAVAIDRGPKCSTAEGYRYPFDNGDYLSISTLWTVCKGPGDIVTWHLTHFSMLLIMGAVQAVLCAVQVINGLNMWRLLWLLWGQWTCLTALYKKKKV